MDFAKLADLLSSSQKAEHWISQLFKVWETCDTHADAVKVRYIYCIFTFFHIRANTHAHTHASIDIRTHFHTAVQPHTQRSARRP